MQLVRMPVVVSLLMLGSAAGAAALAPSVADATLGPTVTLFGATTTLGLRLETVPLILVTFIATLGLITAVYAGRNFRGRAGLQRFALLHSTAVVSLGVMVTAASLPVMALGWTLSGLAIAGLVSGPGTRPALRAGAYVRRRLLAADTLLWSGVGIAALSWASLDLSELDRAVAGAPDGTVNAVGLLLVGAGVIRSALVPGHRWLFETAEAPSPVSALLHAGVVNAVGILGVLAWPIFGGSRAALATLILVGAATAAWSTWLMRYRADVKGRLAASTSAQMGYLAIQVGLGLPVAALLHLMGHGFYKVFLFLRAGGEITRRRTTVIPIGGSGPDRGLGAGRALAAAALAGLGLVAGLQTWTAIPLAEALVLAVGTSAAAVAAHSLLARDVASSTAVGATSRWIAVVAVPVSLAVYVAALGAWLNFIPGYADSPYVWSTAALLSWFVVLAAMGITTVAVLRELHSGRLPWLRARIGAQSLRPGSRLRGAAVASDGSRLVEPQAEVDPGPAVDAALSVVGPGWPLRSAVAVNPIAAMTHLPFEEAAHLVARTWGARLLPPREGFVSLHASGRITDADLDAALARLPGWELPGCELPVEVLPVEVRRGILLGVSAPAASASSRFDDLRDHAAALLAGMPPADRDALAQAASHPIPSRSLTERWDASPRGRVASGLLGRGVTLTDVSDTHASTWLADLLATVDAGGATSAGGAAVPSGLWRSWQTRVASPGMDRMIGVSGFGEAVAALPDEPLRAIPVLLRRAGADDGAPELLARLVARRPGWIAHLAWRAESRADWRVDALAIRLAYDALLVEAVGGIGGPDAATPAVARGSAASLSLATLADAVAMAAEGLGLDRPGLESMAYGEFLALADEAARLVGPAGDLVWQRAYEQRYRNRVIDRIAARAAAPGSEPAPTGPLADVVMCIDVRSERVRRRLEASGDVRTFGFAGFFGLAVRHVTTTGHTFDQCPVLIPPAATVHEQVGRLPDARGAIRSLGHAASRTASAPVAPFALAEAAGPVSGGLAMVHTFAPRLWGSARRAIWGGALRGDLDVVVAMGPAERIAAAEGFLRSIGLVADFGRLILVTGHGARVENNAFAAAYDCGACGGNPGLVNARAMAALLNDPEVRAGLRERGIMLPAGTAAVPALHVTTTDELVVDDADVPPDAAAAVAAWRTIAGAATSAAAQERVATLPGARPAVGDAAGRRAAMREVHRRASDWAEPTPEWGLSGNAIFVAGPRRLTRGLNLDARAFLHSYEPDLDPDRSTLTAILTAPVVVAHMINSQYYTSSVDPHRFGSGDKTTHNVVRDFGVISGAHGDLRVGLPWQALLDQDPRQGWSPAASRGHEPLRLQVLVYAPPADVLGILRSHDEVARLVVNDWLAVAVIDPADATVSRVDNELGLVPWDESAPDLRAAPGGLVDLRSVKEPQ